MMICSTISISKQFVRTYFRKIEPLKITSKGKPKPVPSMGVALKRTQRKREAALEYQEFDEESKADEDNLMGPELSMDFFKEQGYALHQEEMDYRNRRAKESRIIRKHFHEVHSKKEVSILTYAEKQTIKYLHDLDPEEWTIERLAEAFPITEAGVTKLLKTKGARGLTPKEIIEHDQRIVKNLEKIKAGDFSPLSPEFEEKLKMRKTIPLKVGDTSSLLETGLVKSETPNQQERLIGEFERLIIDNGPEKPSAETTVPISPPAFAKADENLITRMTGDEYEHEDFKAQLGLRPAQIVTLDRFEAEVRNHRDKMDLPSNELDKINVLLNMPKSGAPVSVDSDRIMEETTAPLPTLEDYISGAVYVTKYKKHLKPKNPTTEETDQKSQSEDIEVKVERGESYIFDGNTNQYEKPFTTNRPLKVQIPEHLKESSPPDSIYKVGDAYYDENGNFLYRVV